jgi:hypothetical protein
MTAIIVTVTVTRNLKIRNNSLQSITCNGDKYEMITAFIGDL